MSEGKPVACSLNTGELEQRLAAIAELGADSMASHELDGDRHLLRFRSSQETHQRLEAIVAAEKECCTFLELSLAEEGSELILAIAAPNGGGEIADQLARAFAGDER
jgi:hypothetical protein